MSYLHRTIVASSCAGLLVVALGCGSSGPKLYPVSGTLKIAGSPAKGVQIQLKPVDPVDNTLGSATVDDNGHFEILSGVEGNKGVAKGKYKVVLMQMAAVPTAEDVEAMKSAKKGDRESMTKAAMAPPASFASKYAKAETSPEEVVVADKAITLNLDLDGPEN